MHTRGMKRKKKKESRERGVGYSPWGRKTKN